MLFMSGGDIKESRYLRQVFSLLNSDEIDIPDQDFKDNDTLILYKLLKNNVLILKTVFKMLSKKNKKQTVSFLKDF